MATTKPPVPPGNLKDRIAALQQRSVSPSNNATDPANPATGGRVSSLKDKIANFERKGAVPVPRGRFGSSAPPTADGSTKKKGELYGNRVPELAKPTSTAEAALQTRKRTVSTSDASARPASPEEVPPVPALTGDVPKLGSLEPSGLPNTTRRIVSDVGPRTNSSLGSEKSPAEVKDCVSETVDAPAQPKDATPTAEEPASVSLESSKADETSQSGPADDISQPAVVDVKAATAFSPAIEEPVVDASQQNSLVAQDVVSTSAENLTVNTELDNSSVFGDTTASSESVPTPSTSASFTTPTSTADDAKKMIVKDLPRVSIGDRSTPATLDAVSPISAVARSSLNVRQSVTSEMSVSSALEAKIVSEPPKVISPTVTRATIIPAPTLPSIPSPQPVSASEEAALERRTTQRSSFHAVVHRKVRETSASEPMPSVPVSAPAPSKPTPSFPPPRTPATQRIRATVPVEPSSPGLGDLASLMADAALLEEALSSPPPKKQASALTPPAPTPIVSVEPAVPEVPEPAPEAPPVPQAIPEPQPDVFVATLQPQSPPPAYAAFAPDMIHLASGSSQHPTAHVRSRTTPPEPYVPPKEAAPRFSSLRERKQSIPQSVYSQAESTESSVFVARPSSPPSHFRDNDASSVRSSSKSLKGTKRSISRASTWFFKGRNKSNPSLEEQGARQGVSESLLMPHPPVPPLPTQAFPPDGRPTSMMSVASNDGFDLDAFPSVPGGAAAIRPHSMQYHNIAEYTNQQQGNGHARPHTMYAPARKQ